MGAIAGAYLGSSLSGEDAGLLGTLGSAALGGLAGRTLLRTRFLPPGTGTYLKDQGIKAGKGVANFMVKNPAAVAGTGLGGYYGAQASLEGLDAYHMPVEFGNTGLYLKKPDPNQKIVAALTGAVGGGIGGAILGAATPGLAKAGLGYGRRVATSAAGNPLVQASGIGAASGAATEAAGSFISGDAENIGQRLVRGALVGGAGGALARKLSPSKANALAAGLYPAGMLGAAGVGAALADPESPEVIPDPTPITVPIETTLEEASSDMNPYVAGGLGALGTAGLIYGANKLLGD